MKLLNHLDCSQTTLSSINMDIDRHLQLTSEELKLYEDKFFKTFYLNPCPMSLSDYYTGEIVEINQAFLEMIGLKDKNYIKGKSTTKMNIISEKNKNHIIKKIITDGYLKNYVCEFKRIDGKKRAGMFSGSLIEINNKTCLMLICQVINKKFLTGLFKTFLIF
jgi:PAS domain-containing protein